MLNGRPRLSFGVVTSELPAFLEDESINEFLAKCHSSQTRAKYGKVLFMFFRWLKVCRRLPLNPKQVLDTHLRKYRSRNVDDRRWALKLALDFSRDNPELKDTADQYRRLLFVIVRSWFGYHECEISSNGNPFGKCAKRKFRPKQPTVGEVKKILTLLNQRDRTILLMMFQSGQGVGQILNDVNWQLPYLRKMIARGAERIRLDFKERKGNDTPYFSYISKDAIQELRKWLVERDHLLVGKADPNCVFITRNGDPLTVQSFDSWLGEHLRRLRVTDGAYMLVSHQFRKLFKTEASVPERNVDPSIVEFLMGHNGGLNGTGGIYDRTPEIHEDIIEREYAKLEPYLNLFTGVAVASNGFSAEDMGMLQEILEAMKGGRLTLTSQSKGGNMLNATNLLS